MSHDLLLLLRRSPAFARLDDEELHVLRDAFRVGEHAPGYVFCREGERSEGATGTRTWVHGGGVLQASCARGDGLRAQRQRSSYSVGSRTACAAWTRLHTRG